MITKLKAFKTFDGETAFYSHNSESTKTSMKFSVFVPNAEQLDSAIIWLSGLTCNEENFITKAGAQRFLSGTRTMIICPDTSPRDLNLPGEHESYDFGSGAGFYINATTPGYRDHYRMYDYVCKDIVEILQSEFSIQNISIMGHSMGGHGALVLGLRNPELFKSVSAFAPIAHPTYCAWGRKAFSGYLGDDARAHSQYDATELLKQGHTTGTDILIDQGLADEFLKDQLLTQDFEKAAKEHGQRMQIRYHRGYDHSYYYIATFIEDHVRFHLHALE